MAWLHIRPWILEARVDHVHHEIAGVAGLTFDRGTEDSGRDSSPDHPVHCADSHMDRHVACDAAAMIVETNKLSHGPPRNQRSTRWTLHVLHEYSGERSAIARHIGAQNRAVLPSEGWTLG